MVHPEPSLSADGPRSVEDAYQALIDLTGVARILLDGDGRVLEANAEYLRLAGRDPGQERGASILEGRTIFEDVLPADRDQARAAFRNAAVLGKLCSMAVDFQRPDGSRLPVECSGVVVDRSEGIRVLAICKDVSRQRQAERDVSERDARLAAFFETAVDGIVTIDERGTVETFNPAAVRMFGYEVEEVVGQNISMLMPAPYHEEHDGYLDRYLATGERRIIGLGREVLGLRKDGTTFHLNLSVAEMRIGDRRMFSGLIHDLTDRKQLETRYLQAQKMEAVGRLASGIAHDFNNLLMGIQGCCRMAAAEVEPTSSALVPMQEILNAAERGTALTRQLLAFSRNRELEPRPILVNDALSAARVMLRHLLGEDVTLEMQLAPLGGPVLADEGQIEQILMNLAVNSRDAMPGGGKLSIRAEELDSAQSADPRLAVVAPGRWVVVEVRDSGQGMDEATLARAFEPFFTTKPEGQGTGLGLASTYGIVRQLEGHIELESELGRGTLVRMFLPERAPGELGATLRERLEPAPRRLLDVLLVEDDRLVRAGLRHLLRSMGHRVVDAAGADEALALCGQGVPIDLLLTDIVMPKKSGPALAQEFRVLRPTARVLFMSAFSGELLVEQGRLAPGEPTIEKPFTEEQLDQAIRRLLERG
jgi:PAS domain S-box-containing protein